jgi:TRAP-type C4-dicarboxylate transport system substrate-binding protein
MSRTTDTVNTKILVPVLVVFVTVLSLGSASAQQGRVGAFSLPNSPWDIQWQRFRNAVDEAGLELDYFIRGELGSEEAMLSALKRNRLQVAGISLQGITSVVPEVTVAMAPFVFQTAEEVDYVYDTYLLDLVNETLAEQGLVLLRWLESGWFSIGSQRRIQIPADIEGQKIGGSPNVGTQEFLIALKADAIPIASVDLVQALDTGLVDGAIKPTALIYSNLRENVQYITLLKVSYDTGGLLANLSWFESLSRQERDVLRNGHGRSEDVRSEVRQMVEQQIADMIDNGPQVVSLSPMQLKAWRESSQSVHQGIIAKSGSRAPRMWRAIEQGISKFRSRSDSKNDEEH